jgi:hypothetical protein
MQLLLINPIFIALGAMVGVTSVFFIGAEIALNVGDAKLASSIKKSISQIDVSC